MKKIVIFEGVAAAGKTTTEKLLLSELSDVVLIKEDRTLMPLIDNRDAVTAKKYLQGVLVHIQDCKAKTVVVDRFHLTHAFRTNSSLKDFTAIEHSLNKYFETLVVLLTIKKGSIKSRVAESEKIRGTNWSKGKQGSLAEKVTYYQNQQEQLRQLLAESTLATTEIDTTEKQWGMYAREIIRDINW